MTRPIIIGNCSGFFGDRASAAREMVESGPIDVLTGDWLAELTMLILAKSARQDDSLGYAPTFVKQVKDVLEICLERNIKIVSNAGGLNPRGCAEAVRSVAESFGLSPRIAYVTGDDILPEMGRLIDTDGLTLMRGSAEVDPERLVSANVYLGAWGIVEALKDGADIVITGRTTDAAIVCGPAAWWHEWDREQWDELAGAVVAGHVIECGTQAAGGNYSFFTEIPDMIAIGFPIAEISADGSAVITKHPGTGGAVNIGTVTSQLLYEIQSERYYGPDVISRFDTLELNEISADRVLISGVKGEPPTGLFKVSINMIGGFRTELSVAIVGLDTDAKAALLTKAFWAANPYDQSDYDEVVVQVVHPASTDPAKNEEATGTWQITLKSTDSTKVGRAASNAIVELALASIPGFYLLSGPPGRGREFGIHGSALVNAGIVDQVVHVLGAGSKAVPAYLPPTSSPREEIPIPEGATSGIGKEPTLRTPLGTLIGARSGDKGGDANIGVFARSEEAWSWLDAYMTTDRLRVLLPEVDSLAVERFRFPRMWSINFVIHGVLGQGVAASVRQDAQAKSLGEWLRARHVDIPRSLLTEFDI